MKAHLPLIPRRAGRRGAVLMLVGLTWLFIAAQTYTAELVEGLSISSIPAPLKAIGWVVTGVYAFIVGFRAKETSDTLAYLGLYVMPSIWTLLYLYSWWDSLIDGGGYTRGIFSAALFALFMGLIMICAGWAEPPDHIEEDG